MARAFHTTTGTGAVTAALINSASDFLGVSVAAGEVVYIKFYWQNNGPSPTVGTTRPNLTIQSPATGLNFHVNFPVNNGGPLWFWVSAAAGDLDSTALTTGGDVITVMYD